MSQNSQVSTIEKPGQRATIGVPSAKVDAVKAQANGVDKALSGRRATVRLHATSDQLGQEAVPVGVNGVMYLIPRDVECDIPYEVLDVLKNAVTQIISTNKDGSESSRESPRFNFSVLSIDPLAA